MKKHNKHALLNRPKMGSWGRSEYAVLGTACDKITALVCAIDKHISPQLRLAYMDASHSSDSYENDRMLSITVHDNHVETHRYEPANKYNNRILLNDSDIQLINGNHFLAEQQIVVLGSKEESLSKKTDRLTNLRYIITTHEQKEPWSFLKEFIHSDTRIISIDELERLSEFLIEDFHKKISLNALILAGGKSQRMGFDKAKIEYHGDSQVNHLARLLKNVCDKVYVSLRADQTNEFDVERIDDRFIGMGPLGGILSAFNTDTNAAWLTIATDLPFVDSHSIDQLSKQRDRSKIATCFIRSDSEFPDPLFTIWEPKSYQHLLSYLALGYACPRKVIINSDVKVIPIEDDLILTNVNTNDELNQAKQKLR
jgi:molybdopterin-guanine dinucleotide biosynthesis protein A